MQTDPELLRQIGRIANAQIIMGVVAALFALIALGAAVLSYKTMKSLGRTLRALDRAIDQLGPRTQPIIDGVSRVAQDAGAISDQVRDKVDGVLETVDDINLRLRDAADAAEQRVRQFGAVLDVVQAEAEEVLLDAAATAHGVHSAARALREQPPARRRLRRTSEEIDHDE